jgi:tetratricopeptide (TPR) repeat protein
MESKAAPTPGIVKFQAWFEVNKKRVLTGALIVLVVGLLAGLAINYQSQKEVRASEALSEIKLPSSPTMLPGFGTADAYLQVARAHKGTQAAGRALIMAGSTFFTQGQYEDAKKQFEQFVRDYPASPFVAEAQYGIASCLDAEKKTTEAIAKLEELRRRYAKSSVMDETKLSLARLYEEQGKPAQAVDLYDELIKANPYGGIGSEAGLRMEDLLAQHPELRKTNAPPIIASNPNALNTNRVVRNMTNRPQMTISNVTRRTSSVPTIIMTNRTGTNAKAPPKLTISTNN